MAVLNCIKPGVKPGQIILAIDLTVAGSAADVLGTIASLGYMPAIRHIAYPEGVHVLAILKDEQHESVTDDYLLNEWQNLCTLIDPNAVHLWRGQAQKNSSPFT